MDVDADPHLLYLPLSWSSYGVDGMTMLRREYRHDVLADLVGRWRSWEDEEMDMDPELRSVSVDQPAEAVTIEGNSALSRTHSETPLWPVLKTLIREALSSNPSGLRSDEVFH